MVPAAKGMAKLSSKGRGSVSTNIPIEAPKKDFTGLRKNRQPINAKMKPKTVPSIHFPLLKG